MTLNWRMITIRPETRTKIEVMTKKTMLLVMAMVRANNLVTSINNLKMKPIEGI